MKQKKEKKEIVTIANYQKLAMRTCLPSAKNWGYAHYGLLSEVYELNAKALGGKAKLIRDGKDFDKDKTNKAIIDEIGDCYWFIALMCEITDSNFENVYNDKFSAFKMAWKFARKNYGIVKSVRYSFEMLKLISSFKKQKTAFGFLTCDILQRNIAKLSSRKARGVLKGNGDSR